MKEVNFKPENIYFKEPRLAMSSYGRMFVRVASYTTYGVIAAAAVVFSISDIDWLRSLGILLALFLINRIFNIGKSKKSLARLPKTGLPAQTGKINASEYFSPMSFRLLEKAYDESIFKGSNFTLRFLRLLAGRSEIQKALRRMNVSLKDFIANLNQEISQPTISEDKSHIKSEISYLSIYALRHAVLTNGGDIKPKDLFAGVIKLKDKKVMKLMNAFSIEEDDLENALIFSQFRKKLVSRRHPFLNAFLDRHAKIRHRVMNRAWTARPTSFLDRFSKDLTDIVGYSISGFLIGHDKEYEQLVDILSRPGNSNALLIGEASSGKSALVEHLAFQIKMDKVPPPLFDKRLVSLSLSSLAAGIKTGELQQRVERVVHEIVSAGNIILYIPDIHNLVKSGGYLQMTIADVLIPVIKNSEFPVIGGTFPREFEQMIQPLSDFRGAFEVVRVREVTEKEAVKILIHQSLILEAKFNLVISFKAIKEAVLIAHKYFRQKLLPASALDLLKEALSFASQRKKDILTPEDVIQIAERRVNVPMHEVMNLEAERLLDLENIIHEELVDQDEAVSAASRVIREYRSGLARRGGPIANFLFVGPTGVGKTELSKVLAKIQFGDEKLMIRFDMSEYQSKQSFIRLIGSPDGSIRGNLTDAVIDQPYSLVLLDEFEKAHPDILNLFLQVFDDGRLTDNLERVVDFENTIIIATSNAHSEFIKHELENKTPIEEISEILKRKLTDYFKAELLNRFSEIIVFKPLSKKDLESVTQLRLKDLADLVSKNQGLELSFSGDVVKEIAKLGYSPAYGARPLRKTISLKIRSVLAEKLLRKEIKKGDSVRVELEGGEIIFSV